MRLAAKDATPLSDEEAEGGGDDPFPIQQDSARIDGVIRRVGPTRIPRWLAEMVYDEYANRYGTSQSLDRLGERGGFGRRELLTLLKGYLNRHPEVTY